MRINILAPQDARRIAAGEVIDRPASALRELIDNAIDSGASEIAIYLEQGGIKSLEVVDNGNGITADDLPLAILPHATSKIKTIHDLQTIYTLGFRGEALASMAACSRLQIKSREANEDGYLLQASAGKADSIEPVAMATGTAVKVSEIFYNLSARRHFLKSAGAETTECQKVFFEKALAFSKLNFKFFTDGHLKFYFTATDRLGRLKQIYNNELGIDPYYHSNSYSLEWDGFELEIVSATWGLYRGDRRYLHIYINGRRIIDYGLMQAVQYAFNTIMPAGQFPIAFVFIKVRADLADFNIHPAKREAKLHNIAELRKAINNMLTGYFGTIKQQSSSDKPVSPISALNFNPLLNSDNFGPRLNNITTDKKQEAEVIKVEPLNSTPSIANKDEMAVHEGVVVATPHYLGQLMGVFLLVEWGDTLYLIDHHAAHERILFDELSLHRVASQTLLSPFPIELNSDQQKFVLNNKTDLEQVGLKIEALNDSQMLVTACPDGYSSDFWQQIISDGLNVQSLQKAFYAGVACKRAIKEGEYLEPETARNLIAQTFALPHPYCPHGRPIWIEIGREQLYRWIKRLV
jgi:DNA mismatch repair protein MutL